jgi:hypothetical protein
MYEQMRATGMAKLLVCVGGWDGVASCLLGMICFAASVGAFSFLLDRHSYDLMTLVAW